MSDFLGIYFSWLFDRGLELPSELLVNVMDYANPHLSRALWTTIPPGVLAHRDHQSSRIPALLTQAIRFIAAITEVAGAVVPEQSHAIARSFLPGCCFCSREQFIQSFPVQQTPPDHYAVNIRCIVNIDEGA